MNAADYYELFRYLMERYCLLEENMIFVENVSDWCKDQGIPEPDRERPLKLVAAGEGGCRMLIREDIPEPVMDERINALRIRSQMKNVAFDRADLLNSDRKRLAYLFLSEYAASLPDIGHDELLADDWAFQELEKHGFFKA